MRAPSLEMETVFKSLTLGLSTAALGVSAWFSIQGMYAKSSLYMSGAVLMSQFVIMYSIKQGNRTILASQNLLEDKLEPDEDEETLEENTEADEE